MLELFTFFQINVCTPNHFIWWAAVMTIGPNLFRIFLSLQWHYIIQKTYHTLLRSASTSLFLVCHLSLALWARSSPLLPDKISERILRNSKYNKTDESSYHGIYDWTSKIKLSMCRDEGIVLVQLMIVLSKLYHKTIHVFFLYGVQVQVILFLWHDLGPFCCSRESVEH